MPIYEYRCTACGHELEKLQRLGDAPLTDCPDCGKAELRRLVSAAGFRLKGGGWYETDFKKDGKKNLHDSHGAAKAPAEKKDAGAGESAKPAETKKVASETPAAKPGAA
jgi:putative FmdB family regulatory protein